MRAVIISDTHGALQRSELALRKMEPFDLIIHAGDHWTDGQWLADHFAVPLQAVTGNCDMRGCPARRSFVWFGWQLFVSHGHLQGVNNDIASLVNEARQEHAHLAIYGHTHCSRMDYSGAVVIFNPGSVASPRGSLVASGLEQPTIGSLDVESDYAVLRLVSIYDGATVKQLTLRHR